MCLWSQEQPSSSSIWAMYETNCALPGIFPSEWCSGYTEWLLRALATCCTRLQSLPTTCQEEIVVQNLRAVLTFTAHLCVELGGVHWYLWLYALEFNRKTAQLLPEFDTSSASPMEKKAWVTTTIASTTPYSFPFSNRKTNHITFSLQTTLWPIDRDFPICKWQRPLKAVSWPAVFSLHPPSRSSMSAVVLNSLSPIDSFLPQNSWTPCHSVYSDSHPASPLSVLWNSTQTQSQSRITPLF